MQLVPAAEAAQRGKNEVSSSLLAWEGGRHCRKYLSLLWRRWRGDTYRSFLALTRTRNGEGDSPQLLSLLFCDRREGKSV